MATGPALPKFLIRDRNFGFRELGPILAIFQTKILPEDCLRSNGNLGLGNFGVLCVPPSRPLRKFIGSSIGKGQAGIGIMDYYD
jgi:hypothetical protein